MNRLSLSVVRIFETRGCVSLRRLWLIRGFSLSSRFDVLQASLFDGFAFDLLPSQQDCLTTPEVNISGREVLQAFVVAVVIVVADEGANLRLQVTG